MGVRKVFVIKPIVADHRPTESVTMSTFAL